MGKKLQISIEEEGYQLFGINTILKDYQLCSLINDFFSIETHLLQTASFKEEISVFGDEIDNLKVRLVQNVCGDKPVVFTKLKSFEYIVIVNNQGSDVAKIIQTFENNKEILYISEIDTKHLSTKENTLVTQLFALGAF